MSLFVRVLSKFRESNVDWEIHCKCSKDPKNNIENVEGEEVSQLGVRVLQVTSEHGKWRVSGDYKKNIALKKGVN